MRHSVRHILMSGAATPAPLAFLFANGEEGAWYSASHAYTTTARSTVSGVDDPVGSWTDRSGNNNHAVQATAADRPIRREGPSGNYFIHPLDSNDDLQCATDFENPSAFTLAVSFCTGADITSYQVVAGLQQATGTRYNAILAIQSGNLRVGIKYTDDSQYFPASSVALSAKTNYTAVIHFNSGVVSLVVDGSEEDSDSGTAGALGGGSNTLHVGADISGVRPFLGVLYDAVYLERVITSAEQTTMLAYMESVHDTPYPVTLSSETATAVTLTGLIQGVDINGTDGFATGTLLNKYSTSDWTTTVATETQANLTPGFVATSLGEVKYVDGTLYIACGVYTNGGNAFIIEADPSDLSYSDHQDISDDCTAGVNMVCKRGTTWYVGEAAGGDASAAPAVQMFDASWNHLGTAWVSDGADRVDFNGGEFCGDYLIAGAHDDYVAVFHVRANGTLHRLPNLAESGMVATQGVSVTGSTVRVSNRDPNNEFLSYTYSV